MTMFSDPNLDHSTIDPEDSLGRRWKASCTLSLCPKGTQPIMRIAECAVLLLDRLKGVRQETVDR